MKCYFALAAGVRERERSGTHTYECTHAGTHTQREEIEGRRMLQEGIFNEMLAVSLLGQMGESRTIKKAQLKSINQSFTSNSKQASFVACLN